MPNQYSVEVRNAMLDAFEASVGASPILKLRSGAKPADCATADSGTVLATINLGSDWMSAASAGVKAFSSVPLEDASADAAGTIGHYRLYKNDGTTCVDQGSVTLTGGGGDMTFDNTNVAAGQKCSITAWTKNLNAHA